MAPNSGILSRIFSTSNLPLLHLLGSLSWALQLLYAITTLGSIVALLVNITKLAASNGNPAERSKAIRGILISGSCLAVLGSLGLIYIFLVSFIA